MEGVVLILYIAAAAFVIGGLARLAVPGPDPMPAWLTIAIGLISGLVGGGVGASVGGVPGAILASVIVGSLLVILYRRTVQKRGVTGPEAQRFPRRGWGVARARRRLGFAGGDDTVEQLRRLGELRDAGTITSDEFEAKKAELLARL